MNVPSGRSDISTSSMAARDDAASQRATRTRRRGPLVVTAIAAAALGVIAATWHGRGVQDGTTGRAPVQREPASRAPDRMDAPAQAAQHAAAAALIDMTLKTADGTPATVRSVATHGIRIVNFWASWCGPCVEEMPMLSAWTAATRTASPERHVVGIAVDTPANVSRFLARTPVTYPVLVGDAPVTSLFARLGNPEGLLPFTVVIDADGRVKETVLGKMDQSRLDSMVK